jgi:hypothetical protein
MVRPLVSFFVLMELMEALLAMRELEMKSMVVRALALGSRACFRSLLNQQLLERVLDWLHRKTDVGEKMVGA